MFILIKLFTVLEPQPTYTFKRYIISLIYLIFFFFLTLVFMTTTWVSLLPSLIAKSKFNYGCMWSCFLNKYKLFLR